MSRHRAEYPPLIVTVDGKRCMWRPSPDGKGGSMTAPASITERLAEVFEAKSLVPTLGVLVMADPDTAPGVLAGLTAIATHSAVINSIPPDLDGWFAAHREHPGTPPGSVRDDELGVLVVKGASKRVAEPEADVLEIPDATAKKKRFTLR